MKRRGFIKGLLALGASPALAKLPKALDAAKPPVVTEAAVGIKPDITKAVTFARMLGRDIDDPKLIKALETAATKTTRERYS